MSFLLGLNSNPETRPVSIKNCLLYSPSSIINRGIYFTLLPPQVKPDAGNNFNNLFNFPLIDLHHFVISKPLNVNSIYTTFIHNCISLPLSMSTRLAIGTRQISFFATYLKNGDEFVNFEYESFHRNFIKNSNFLFFTLTTDVPH